MGEGGEKKIFDGTAEDEGRVIGDVWQEQGGGGRKGGQSGFFGRREGDMEDREERRKGDLR